MKTIKEIQDIVEKKINKHVDYIHTDTRKNGIKTYFFWHLRKDGKAEEFVYINGDIYKTKVIETEV